jgi:hypothetical protein
VEDAIPQGIPAGGLQTGHEKTTIEVGPLLISAVVLAAVIVVCQFVLLWWMRDMRTEEVENKALHPGRQEIPVEDFPQPRLQKRPPVELSEINREERIRTSSYGWVDKKAGIARIPVDRAIEILAQKGLPRVAAPPPTPGAPPNTTIPPAGKRDEAHPASSTPALQKKADEPRPQSKQGGKP